MDLLQCGVARKVITPAVGGQLYGYRPDVFSEALEDDLTATAFYFKQGTTEALMVSLTVCLLQTALAERIRALIEAECGVPKEACILSATHTHSGPNTAGTAGWGDLDRPYCEEIFIPRILAAAKNAKAAARPVQMSAATGESPVGINRRELNEQNKVILGQNPWGCFNPRMTVLSFTDEKGAPYANLIHYGAHGTAAGRNHEITRDWSGRMTDALEAETGGITAFFNGPEGDVGPRLSNGKTVGDITHVRELGAIAARDALKIFGTRSAPAETRLSVSCKTLLIPLQKRMPEEQARQELELYKNETVNRRGMMRNQLEAVLQSYREGRPEPDSFGVEQTLVTLGDFVFASFPFELFSEIGMRIDQAIPQKTILSLSNANGSEGYFVTEDALCRGGYEVFMHQYGHEQAYVNDADYRLMQETVRHIQESEE